MPDRDGIRGLSTAQVVIRITGIIACAELVIMLLLGSIHHDVSMLGEALLDVLLLAVLSTPPIWFLVIRPFVHARDEALERVSRMAFTDVLTGVPNRRMLTAHLQQAMASEARHGDHGALLLVDLDGFKSINDVHGHDAGDAILVAVAARLRATTRAEDVVGRLGGDEFAVLVNRLDADLETARQLARSIAEKMFDEIKRPVDYRGKPLFPSASIGVRILDASGTTADVALRDADQAMYRAKAQPGRHVALSNEPVQAEDLAVAG